MNFLLFVVKLLVGKGWDQVGKGLAKAWRWVFKSEDKGGRRRGFLTGLVVGLVLLVAVLLFYVYLDMTRPRRSWNPDKAATSPVNPAAKK